MKLFLAYIDPASGSIVFQMILASVIGFFVYLKRIKLFFFKLFHKSRKEDSE